MALASPFDCFNLHQYPRAKQGKAYNSADTLLVEATQAEGYAPDKTLVINDEFGALSVALQAGTLWTDSCLASISLTQNLLNNQLGTANICWSTQQPSKYLSPDHCAVVVMRVPKQSAYFEYQLSLLSQYLLPLTPVLVAGMDKHLPPGTAKLLEAYIGPTQRHKGQRKARLFSALRDDRQPSPYTGISKYYCEPLHGELISMSNVFSREKLDIGSRFFLENLDRLDAVDKIIDLACGNAVIGLSALHAGLCTELLLCDESAMAINSARVNSKAICPGQNIHFHHGDGLLGYSGEPAQLIVCNPPFHLNHRIDESVGRRLLVQAASHLQKGGAIALVANRHLNYFPILKREFTTVERLAQNSKFIIWKATI